VLRELSVQNLALIEDVHVVLEGGYCAWTGETGAGKSLLLSGLGLVLGSKASNDLIRSGKNEARAAAVFELSDPAVRSAIEAIIGGPLEDDQLIISRRVATQGRGGAHINGLPVTLGVLQQLGEHLVDIHGQLEGRALLNPDSQRAMLDAYGELDAKVGAYALAQQEHEELRSKRQALFDSAEARRRERALLEFERDVFAEADPKPGEYAELAREARRLASAEQVRTASATGYSLLYEAEPSAVDLLSRVARTLEPLAENVAELSKASAALERLADETREVAFHLRNLGRDWDDDPAQLEDAEARMALYRRLAARFHCSPDELTDRRAETENKLAALDHDDASLAALDAPLAAAWQAVQKAALRLSEGRRKAAKNLARAIQAQLTPLSLGGARLTVEVETRDLGHDPLAATAPQAGADRVEMLFSANPGEEPRPLRKIASGGELSRVTLAVKTVLAAVDRVPTLVFDEIDTGVGGRLGAALGMALSELAKHHQVICVTHLPQIASYADHHWVIHKHVERGRSSTTIRLLKRQERVEELAAMLRGESAAEGTRKEALAMLREAQLAKPPAKDRGSAPPVRRNEPT
jgi:DNA repair protein RecN (Recombination protein N)